MSARRKKPSDISQEDWDSADVPKLTDADFARARPFKEMFPEQYQAWKRMGRPPTPHPKVHISLRLAADIVERLRAVAAIMAASRRCCATPWPRASFD